LSLAVRASAGADGAAKGIFMKNHLDQSDYLIRPGTPVKLDDISSCSTGPLKDKCAASPALAEDVSDLQEAQAKLYASQKHGVLIIFQALDAAGKDGTIKHVMSGVNPQGCAVHSFKAPNAEERLHHFLWRPMNYLPPRGMIAIFNRSYYEEVLVVRVHPELLDNQFVPGDLRGPKLWKRRFFDINRFEAQLHEYGITVIKFFLHVSRKEQRKRFMERLDNPEKHWKFSAADVRERGHWKDYQRAFEEMLSATSTRAAPWYVVPADKKWFMRACVADILTSRLEALKLEYPEVSAEQKRSLEEARRELLAEE